jgi:hypothetical protein
MTPRDYAAEPGARRFRESLLDEHLEDAAFLYGQRTRHLQSDLPWTAIEGLEARLEAHLDALALAGPAALARALARAGAGVAGDAFVAISVACRHRDRAALTQVLQALDATDAALAPAVRDALYVELPADWQALVREALEQPASPWLASMADLCGRRRFDLLPSLAAALARREATPSVAAALGRLRATTAHGELRACLHEGDAAARSGALLALCRLGDVGALANAVPRIAQESWPREAAGLAGGASCARALIAAAEGGRADAPTLRALGLLGDPAALSILYRLLAQPQWADAAARALYWITGAPMMKERFVPDPVDEAALTAEEVTRWRADGEAPRRSDGEPYGTRDRALTTDAEEWRAWLEVHAPQFRKGQPYRMGQPYRLESVAALLESPDTDGTLRGSIVQELAIRFGCDIPLEPELPVVVQRRLLHRLTAWAGGQAHRFEAGRWYAAAEPAVA